MAPTTRSQSSQPQHDEGEGPLEFHKSQSKDPASSKPGVDDDASSDSEPAPVLNFKSGKTLKMWKKGKTQDPSYKPSKESDQSDDTDVSQDVNESPLDKPSWNNKSSGISQPGKKTKKKKKQQGHKGHKSSTFKVPDSEGGGEDDDDDDLEDAYPSPSEKEVTEQPSAGDTSGHKTLPEAPQKTANNAAPGIPAPEIPAPEIPAPEIPAPEFSIHKHKSPMPTIPGFDTIFQTNSKAGAPAAPRPSNGNTSKNLPPSAFQAPPKPPQHSKPKEQKAANDGKFDDDQIPWMTGPNRKRKMPDIPGFADIFQIGRPPSKTAKPYSYYTHTKPSNPKAPKPHIKPQITNPQITKVTPNQMETQTFKEKPPQFPALQFPNAVQLEPGLLKDRDWPPYPGTIYCKRCFYHDCFRAIKIRRHILRILRLLEDGKAFLHFLKEVCINAAMKSPHLANAFGKDYFYQQIPGDVTALALLDQIVRHVEQILPVGPGTETHAKINSHLQEIRSLLNLPDAQYHRITTNWFDSATEMQRKLQEAGYSLPKVETAPLRAIKKQIIETLDVLLGNDIKGSPDPYDDEWFDAWRRAMEENISVAVRIIDYKKSLEKPGLFKSPDPPRLSCSYCLHSGAENKAKANRPYPRDMAADARIPWAESLHKRYPGSYDKNGNAITTPYAKLKMSAPRPVRNAEEFLDKLRAEGAQEVSQGGIKFLVWKGGHGLGDGVRIVLVKIWSLVEAIESLEFVPVEHAKLEKVAG